MKGLLLRLSALDVGAETAVRVIAYFDGLIEHRATAAELVRSAAALAECPAGLERQGEAPLRFAANGSAITGTPAPSGGMELAPGTGRVWLYRPGGPGPFDDLVLERFALSARLLAGPAPHLADPALVELVLSEREGPEDRGRALRLLGLDPAAPVRVVAVAAPEPRAAALALLGRTIPVRVAVIDGLAAVLVAGGPGELHPVPTVRVGIGGATPGAAARRSWAQARLAVRFAVADGSADAVADHDALGSMVLLAELPPERLRAQPDVVALAALAATASGAPDVATLEAFCRTGSLRQAAALLHLHHSSVAARLAHVESALGWRLDEPDGRFRARFALLARRLALD
ncbi:helix-turn-helix domain-containing protein [Pseudonocardia sp. GCM10023141]|uniref:helix-turn-helix domain-containing protein n=1 Tax=Pseudonocardia sp. GCM10023141 TaxID=3252653 RepID=UPI003615477B